MKLIIHRTVKRELLFDNDNNVLVPLKFSLGIFEISKTKKDNAYFYLDVLKIIEKGIKASKILSTKKTLIWNKGK